ncbi:MAG: TadE/TadG family type IV pilus assembly protein [Beijerinckiaceae bacterium]
MRSMRLSCLRRFARDRKGNIAMIFALLLLPIVFAIGVGIDYTSAARKRSQLDAAADAAVLAAVTPTMLVQSTAAATTAAQNMFNGQIGKIPGLGAVTLTVTIPAPNCSNPNGLSRCVQVCYSTTSKNAFASIIGRSTLALAGCSTASASSSPNINFWLLLDDSPSMAIAGTPAGITTMVNNTSAQGGCAFACHETNPSGENPALGNPHGEDNYALARSLGVTLRIDLLASAVSSLLSTAQTDAAKNGNTYEAAVYTFDSSLNTIYPANGQPTSNLSAAASAASNITMLEVYDNNCLTQNNCNNDTDTNFESAMSTMNTNMPNPGNGTNQPSDTPQEVLFIVSDGVDDEYVAQASDCSQPTSGTPLRCQQPFPTAWCTTIKNRGIRIAVLYTEYLQLPTNAWYNDWIAPFDTPTPSTSLIATNMQACASPGLFFDVASGGDVTAALTSLYNTVVATAPGHLTQ